MIDKFIPKEYIDTVVVREEDSSGVLVKPPLLKNICESGCFGTHYSYRGGSADRSLFVFLSGNADRQFFEEHPELFFGTYLVCLSAGWEDFLLSLPYERLRMTRWMMKPLSRFSYPAERKIPEGYRIEPFDADAFALHPFDHGCQYADAADFAGHGIGSVVRHNGEIVCSASSFISFGSDIELDVSTLPQYRRKGLAEQCLRDMLSRCEERGITVHWDAQNPQSKALAEKFGFSVEQDYAVTMLAKC